MAAEEEEEASSDSDDLEISDDSDDDDSFGRKIDFNPTLGAAAKGGGGAEAASAVKVKEEGAAKAQVDDDDDDDGDGDTTDGDLDLDDDLDVSDDDGGGGGGGGDGGDAKDAVKAEVRARTPRPGRAARAGACTHGSLPMPPTRVPLKTSRPISTRILGRRTAPFRHSLSPTCVLHGFLRLIRATAAPQVEPAESGASSGGAAGQKRRRKEATEDDSADDLEARPPCPWLGLAAQLFGSLPQQRAVKRQATFHG